MQVRPTTAAMLGHSGTIADLHEPSTNIRYGVRYLAEAWKLANGDLCRALMKYRAGHGEERFSERSAEYCRRARAHLSSLGSPLAIASRPQRELCAFSCECSRPGAGTHACTLSCEWSRPGATSQSVGSSERCNQASTEPAARAAHDARMKAILSKVSSASLRIATGL